MRSLHATRCLPKSAVDILVAFSGPEIDDPIDCCGPNGPHGGAWALTGTETLPFRPPRTTLRGSCPGLCGARNQRSALVRNTRPGLWAAAPPFWWLPPLQVARTHTKTRPELRPPATLGWGCSGPGTQEAQSGQGLSCDPGTFLCPSKKIKRHGAGFGCGGLQARRTTRGGSGLRLGPGFRDFGLKAGQS